MANTIAGIRAKKTITLTVRRLTPWTALHPAHRTFEMLDKDYRRHGIARLGSVVIDAAGTTLTSRFIDDKGEVLTHLCQK